MAAPDPRFIPFVTSVIDLIGVRSGRASEAIKLRQAFKRAPTSPLIRRRLGILYDNAIGGGDVEFSQDEKERIGQALVMLQDVADGKGPGRPTLSETNEPAKILNVTISQAQFEELDEQCRERGINRSQAVRQALEAWFKA